jgi:hypothetical protein
LKKQKAKKAGGAKKKEDESKPADPESSTAAEKTEETPDLDGATLDSRDPAEDDEPSELLPKSTPSHGHKPSVAVESRLRSASFYRGGDAGPTSPTAITPGGGVSSDIYREQAQRIEELERENKKLASDVEESERRWKRGEEELEDLREGRGDIALAVEKGKEADKLVSRLDWTGSKSHQYRHMVAHVFQRRQKSSR